MRSDRSNLESFEQNLIDIYGVQIHRNARIAFGEDRFWDVDDEFCVVKSGTAYESFHLFIKLSKDASSEIDTFRIILQRLNLVASLIEVTQLQSEDTMKHFQDDEKRARYIEVDYAIMACAFAQIVKYGTVTDGFMKIFIISILRQLNPVLSRLICNGDHKEMDRRNDLIEDFSNLIVNIVRTK